MKSAFRCTVFATLLCAIAVAMADELPGHSDHGEAFNEGPRQAAHLMGGTGNVHWKVSTTNPLAQQFFDQGWGQMHGFWYFEAERSFRQVAAIDRNCAMAYWGMAMANVNNNKRAKGFIAEAVKRKGSATKLEQMHIDALEAYIKASDTKDKAKLKQRSQAYIEALTKITTEFPDDIESRALLALKYWQDKDANPIKDYEAVDKLLQQVFAVNPMHPAHHFRIHLWNGKNDARAIDSAARCGQTSPSIAHMWHMSGHTFSKLKRYDDAAWQQEASARTDHAYMMANRVLPDQIHNFAHNNEWCIRDLNFIGRVGDAVDLAKNMIELPQHPGYNSFTKKGSSLFGRERLIETLEQYELFNDLIALSKTAYLPPTEVPAEQARLARALGIACYRTGRIGEGDTQLAVLEAVLKKLPVTPEKKPEAKKQEVAAKSDGKADGKKSPAKTADYEKKERSVREQVTTAIAELKAWRLAGVGDYGAAADALAAVKSDELDRTQVARLQLLAGRGEEAVKTAAAVVKKHDKEVQPLAQLVDILWQTGKADEAMTRFAELRAMSSRIDLRAHSPVFTRLEPVAAAAGHGDDWRVAYMQPSDVGNRPPLDSLGPFRWQPLPAPSWTLPDPDKKPVALESYRGKPVVVIFYLGYGCVHCVQQIRAFAPMAGAYKDAGIDIVAVSTDTVSDLHKSLEETPSTSEGSAAGEPKFPLRLVSDAGLNVFRAYRCFDDFEGKPLHGTFLIDANGLVRWQDISYEPFMDAKFLLAESKRLLAQKR